MSEAKTFLVQTAEKSLAVKEALAKLDTVLEEKLGDKRKELKRKRDAFQEEQEEQYKHFNKEYVAQKTEMDQLEQQIRALYPVPEHCTCDNSRFLMEVLEHKRLVFPKNHDFIEWLKWHIDDFDIEDQEEERDADTEHLVKHNLTRDILEKMVKVEKVYATFTLTGHLDGYKGEDTNYEFDQNYPPEVDGYPEVKLFSEEESEWGHYYSKEGIKVLPEDHDTYWASMKIRGKVALVTAL